jgi:hypothetical protein
VSETIYKGRCPLCGETGTSEHGPQSAILAHVGAVHMTPDVAVYLREALRIMGPQWFVIGLSEAAGRKPRRARTVKQKVQP